MRLLILTQKVDLDDDVLGFMHGWIAGFAKELPKVTVVCLQKGTVSLPEHVGVHSLGKEERESRVQYLLRFYRHIIGMRHHYDAVFVHMNHEYVLLGGIVWRLFRKPIGLWYAHGHVPKGLRLASRLAHTVFTSTESGFRLPGDHVRVIGQGVNIQGFPLRAQSPQNTRIKLVTIGRLSPVKKYETMIEAMRLLKERGVDCEAHIVGSSGTPEQISYEQSLHAIVELSHLRDRVIFHGSIPHTKIYPILESADIFINTSLTGSLDKAVVEAMSVGVPVITCNEALTDVLGPYAKELMFEKEHAEQLADRIEALMKKSSEDRRSLSIALHDIVEKHHSRDAFIRTIVSHYSI